MRSSGFFSVNKGSLEKDRVMFGVTFLKVYFFLSIC